MAASRALTALRLFAPAQGKSVLANAFRAQKQLSIRSISFSRVLEDRYFSKEHEWIDVDGNMGTVGITKFAQEALGELVYVELPELEEEFGCDDGVGVVESVKAASDVMTPVSGTTKVINEELTEDPTKINKDPEGDGWLFKIELSDPSELDELMNEKAYKAFCEEGS